MCLLMICSPCQHLVDYGNAKIIQHAQKSLQSVEVGHSTETEAEETFISASMVLYLWGKLT